MKYEELVKAAINNLEDDERIFTYVIEELDSWNGFADGFRVYNMCDLDEFFYGLKPTELLEKLCEDFDVRCEYFADTIYGLESVADINDVADWYKDHTSAEEVYDNLLENLCHIDLECIDHDFAELMEQIDNYEEE